jgi:hypothetical protein
VNGNAFRRSKPGSKVGVENALEKNENKRSAKNSRASQFMFVELIVFACRPLVPRLTLEEENTCVRPRDHVRGQLVHAVV